MTRRRSEPPRRAASKVDTKPKRTVTVYSRGIDQAVSAATAIGLAGWGYLHWKALQTVSIWSSPREATYMFAYFILVWQVVLLVLHPKFRPGVGDQEKLDSLRILIPVPVHNEDPMILRRALASLIDQDRRPDIIHVVDNGSDDPLADYSKVEAWFVRETEKAGIVGVWERVEWKGKRLVHGHTALRWTGHADIYLTVDSDGVLMRNAVRELLAPFADERVQSVAGLVLAENNQVNVMARILDLWFAMIQLVGRASQSTLGAVLVNSGPLAAYRFDVVRDNVDGYLAESFMGRDVHFSDDSMLTLYATARGRAVQNPRALVLVAMPENWSHHIRQYMRWMRGSTIRALWRFRYLPMNRYGYWVNFLNWVQVVGSAAVLVDLFVLAPLHHHSVPLRSTAEVVAVVGYVTTARYLSVRRHDEETASQVLTWLLAPVAIAWSYIILRTMRWYGMATCFKTGWGTRARVEVFYSGPADGAPEELKSDLPLPLARRQPLVLANLPAGLPAVGMSAGVRATEAAAEVDRLAKEAREKKEAELARAARPALIPTPRRHMPVPASEAQPAGRSEIDRPYEVAPAGRRRAAAPHAAMRDQPGAALAGSHSDDQQFSSYAKPGRRRTPRHAAAPAPATAEGSRSELLTGRLDPAWFAQGAPTGETELGPSWDQPTIEIARIVLDEKRVRS